MAQILRYPTSSIGKNDDFFQVNVIEYKPPGISGQGGALKFALGTTEQALQGSIQSPKSTIILPMPQSISDSNSCNWGGSELNAALAAGIQGGQNIIEGDDPFSGAISQGSEIFKQFQGALTSGTGQKAVSTVFSKLAVKALTGQDPNITGLITRETGAVVNQNVEMLFQGVTIRPPFSFTFDLIPRSKPEAEEIKTIIRTFKQEMTPRKGGTGITGGGFFVKSPNVFKIEYRTGADPHKFLNKFKPCALTNMNVNYAGSGQYSTFSDTTPVHMVLTLQFQELSPIYAEDYASITEGVGY
jgi:hypothetical protein